MTDFAPTPFPEAVRNYMRLFPGAGGAEIAAMMSVERRPVTKEDVDAALAPNVIPLRRSA